jgi:prepilin-type N-terminal cleavage/methylation domain-containing protein
MGILEQKANTTQKGFTLVEVMATIIIVGTLAAVAAPQYAGYVQKANSERLEMQRFPSRGFYSAASHEDFLAKGLDLSDTKYFTYQVTTDGRAPATTFTVRVTATNEFSENPDQCTITYRHNRANDPVGEWACDGTCITRDMILRQ